LWTGKAIIDSLTTRLGDRTRKGKSFLENGGETGRLIDKIRRNKGR
jgi:hypothetical protein